MTMKRVNTGLLRYLDGLRVWLFDWLLVFAVDERNKGGEGANTIGEGCGEEEWWFTLHTHTHTQSALLYRLLPLAS